MKLKYTKSLKLHIESLGLTDISKMYSINCLALKNVGVEHLIRLDVSIKEIECGLWKLLLLGVDLDEDPGKFDEHFDYVNELFSSITSLAKHLNKFSLKNHPAFK